VSGAKPTAAPLDAGGFAIWRDPFGRLVVGLADGSVHEGVAPVRPFPISAPEAGLGLMSSDGHELVWLDDPSGLPAAVRELLDEELGRREFMPVIGAILEVSSFATPSTWRVATDRGETSFVLKGEEAIRRLPGGMLLIADSEGIQYLIRDTAALDRPSRKTLDRFL
jgi:hypothetical protein